MSGPRGDDVAELLASSGTHDRTKYAREVCKSKLPPAAKTLLVTLNSCSNSGLVWKSTATISRQYGGSESWIRVKKKYLIQAGWLVPVSAGGGRGKKSQYRLSIPNSHIEYLAWKAEKREFRDSVRPVRNADAKRIYMAALYQKYSGGMLDKIDYEKYAAVPAVADPYRNKVVVRATKLPADDGKILAGLMPKKHDGWEIFVRFPPSKVEREGD